MDTSETNIKMCKKAEGIQSYWRTHQRERDVFSTNGEIHYIGEHLGYGDCWEPGEWMFESWRHINPIWLPSQDRLQEMLPTGLSLKLCAFISWLLGETFENGQIGNVTSPSVVISIGLDLQHKFTSMEQLWLAFVTKENCNKVWNGEEWQ